MLMAADHPLYVSEMQAAVRAKSQLHVSKALIKGYLHAKLDVAYRKIKKIHALHNSMPSKLQR